MKAITANRLNDGFVVYFTEDGTWSHELSKAARVADDAADALLEKAAADVKEIAAAYIINVSEEGTPAGRETLRETIRTAGPTVREDLGYQAGELA